MVDREVVSNVDYRPEPVGTETPTKPDWLPDKFYDSTAGKPNVEALAKSYVELEKKISTTPAKPSPEISLPTKTPAVEPQGDQGIWTESNINRWAQESAANGGALNPESYAEIAKKGGVPRPFVDLFIKSMQNTVTQAQEQDLELVGGAENWEGIRQWASQNYTPEEKAAFQQAMNSGGELKKMALNQVRSRYEADEGVAPERHVSGGYSRAGVKPFESSNDMMQAMSDPRYKIGHSKFSQAYRDEVIARTLAMKKR